MTKGQAIASEALSIVKPQASSTLMLNGMLIVSFPAVSLSAHSCT